MNFFCPSRQTRLCEWRHFSDICVFQAYWWATSPTWPPEEKWKHLQPKNGPRTRGWSTARRQLWVSFSDDLNLWSSDLTVALETFTRWWNMFKNRTIFFSSVQFGLVQFGSVWCHIRDVQRHESLMFVLVCLLQKEMENCDAPLRGLARAFHSLYHERREAIQNLSLG